MKVKDWIKELEKLDPEGELFVEREDGYSKLTPMAEKRDLVKTICYTIPFYHLDHGQKGEPVGKCNVLYLRPW
jgi:hypothetical protein